MTGGIVFDGDARRAITKLKSVRTAAADLSPLWPGARASFVGLVEERFAQQPWPALSPAYEKRKARDGFAGAPMLVRTGQGRRSLTSGLQVFAPERQALTIGSRSPVMRHSARGRYDAKSGRRVPKRPVVPALVFRRRLRARIRRHLLKADKG